MAEFCWSEITQKSILNKLLLSCSGGGCNWAFEVAAGAASGVQILHLQGAGGSYW